MPKWHFLLIGTSIDKEVLNKLFKKLENHAGKRNNIYPHREHFPHY